MSFHSDAPDYSWIYEADPYDYDTSSPNSSFVKFMREQEELFYKTFPEARRAAEEKKRLKAQILDHLNKYGTYPIHQFNLPQYGGHRAAYPEGSSAVFPLSNTPIPLHFDYQSQLLPQDYAFQIATLDHATAAERSCAASSSLGFQPHDELVPPVPTRRHVRHIPHSVFDARGVSDVGHGIGPGVPTFSLPTGGPSPSSCGHPLQSAESGHSSLLSPTFTSGQVAGPSSAAAGAGSPPVQLPQPDPPRRQQQNNYHQSPIHRPTHPAPTRHGSQPYPSPVKITHDKNDRRSPSPSPTLSSQSAGTGASQMPKTAPTSTTSSSGLSWGSRKSSRATMRLSPLPTKRQMEKKPPLACLFCRGRKIACGAPLPGSADKTCNQCQRRSLQCEYPAESRRGMRKKKVVKGNEVGRDESMVLPGESILIP